MKRGSIAAVTTKTAYCVVNVLEKAITSRKKTYCTATFDGFASTAKDSGEKKNSQKARTDSRAGSWQAAQFPKPKKSEHQ